MFPQGGCAVRLGRMDEKKWRFTDDDVVVTLIYDFEMEGWSNGIMEEEICMSSKAITLSVSNRAVDSRA